MVTVGKKTWEENERVLRTVSAGSRL